MGITGQLTLDQVAIYQVDADPSVSGFSANVGSIATLYDGTNGRVWIKSGAANTAWAIVTRHVDGTQLTQGGVLYASSQGFIQQNPTNFFWDITNSRLGIGTNVPDTQLHVSGSTSASALIKATATNGVSFLDMKNDANSYIETGMYGTASTSTIFGVNMANSGFIIGAGTNMVIGNFTSAPIIFGTNSLERMRINEDGQVLIGGTTPQDITGSSVFPPFQILGTNATQMIAAQYSADINPSAFNLLKSRGTTIGSQGLVLNNDEIGRLQFRASDGVNFQAAAAVRAQIDGVAAANSMPGRLNFWTTPTGSITPVERLRIAQNGLTTFFNQIALPAFGTGQAPNFLIPSNNRLTFGETFPMPNATGTQISFSSAAGTDMIFAFSKTGVLTGMFGNTGASVVFGVEAANPIIFKNAMGYGAVDVLGSGTETMRISSTGSVGINTAADPVASARLQVDSTTQGFLMPRMTTAQMEAIATPAVGLKIFNTTLNTECVYNGVNWVFDYYLFTANTQSFTTTTYTNITELTTVSLPAGRYQVYFTGTMQSTATTEGVGLRLSNGTATVGVVMMDWSFNQAANGTDKNYDYAQLAVGTNVTSTGVVTANADFPVSARGIIQLSAAGTLVVQGRTETAALASCSIRANSVIKFTRVS